MGDNQRQMSRLERGLAEFVDDELGGAEAAVRLLEAIRERLRDVVARYGDSAVLLLAGEGDEGRGLWELLNDGNPTTALGFMGEGNPVLTATALVDLAEDATANIAPEGADNLTIPELLERGRARARAAQDVREFRQSRNDDHELALLARGVAQPERDQFMDELSDPELLLLLRSAGQQRGWASNDPEAYQAIRNIRKRARRRAEQIS